MMEPTIKFETGGPIHQPTTYRTASTGPTIDWQYFKSIPGIIKVVELILGILAVGLATAEAVTWTYLFLIVCYFCIFITAFFGLIYFLNLHHKVTIRPSWISMEFYYTVGATFSYALITTIQFASHNSTSVAIAAAVFALFNTIIYTIGLYFIFTEWRNWRNNRGVIPVSRG